MAVVVQIDSVELVLEPWALYFQSFGPGFLLGIQSRTPDYDMVGNDTIRRTAYLRRCIFGILRLPVPK